MPTTDKMFDISGRVAIITGCAGLLGAEHGDVLAQAGASIVVADLREESCEELAERLEKSHDIKALPVVVDISDEKQVSRMVDQVVKTFGRIDILINNAALTTKVGTESLAGYFSPFESYPLDIWEKALKFNLTGAFLCSQAVGKQMLEQKRGVIINILSTYGIVGPDNRIYQGSANPYGAGQFNTPVCYSVSKGALLALTRYLATYWAGKNIRVNALTPGGVYDKHEDEFLKNYSYRTPLGRMAEKTEYRGAILFLASDASSYMTGANLIVDGGWTAW